MNDYTGLKWLTWWGEQSKVVQKTLSRPPLFNHSLGGPQGIQLPACKSLLATCSGSLYKDQSKRWAFRRISAKAKQRLVVTAAGGLSTVSCRVSIPLSNLHLRDYTEARTRSRPARWLSVTVLKMTTRMAGTVCSPMRWSVVSRQEKSACLLWLTRQKCCSSSDSGDGFIE